MAANVDAKVDLNVFLNEIMKSEFGLIFICALLLIIVIVASLHIFWKSGLLSHFQVYSELSNKKFLREIEHKEELLNDESLSEFKGEMAYHIKVSKLENFLKFKNKDIDLLRYILSCRDSARAIRLYKKGSQYLEKDLETKAYRLVPDYTKEKVERIEKRTYYWYFGLNIVGMLPFFLKLISSLNKSWTFIEFKTSDGLLFFILMFLVSLIYTFKHLRPYSALYFLELEKIEKDQSKRDALNDAA